MKREFEDQYGRTMLVGSGEPGEAYLKVSDHLGEFCPKPDDLVDIAVALWKSAGQPVPVITPRPDIDPHREYAFGPLRMRVNPRARGLDLEEGVTSWHWAPSVARQAAGVLVALAGAAEEEPGPAEVDALALVLVEGRDAMGLDGARPLARRILAALPGLGYKREARDDG